MGIGVRNRDRDRDRVYRFRVQVRLRACQLLTHSADRARLGEARACKVSVRFRVRMKGRFRVRVSLTEVQRSQTHRAINHGGRPTTQAYKGLGLPPPARALAGPRWVGLG